MVVSEAEDVRANWEPRLLSVLRIVVALLFLQHGLSKWFGFPGPQPPTFSLLSYPEGPASTIEVVGSLALLAGFYTRIAAFIMSGEMAVAVRTAHVPRGFSRIGVMGLFPYNNGGSLAVCTASCSSTLLWRAVDRGAWTQSAHSGDTGLCITGRDGDGATGE